MKVELKGTPGIIAVVVVVGGAVGWVFYQRATLHAQGREAAREYIAAEITSETMRQQLEGRIAPHAFESARSFKIVEFEGRGLVPRERTTVRVDISTNAGPRTFWLEMRRVFGEWKVRRQLPEPLLGW